MKKSKLTRDIKRKGLELGFSKVGITTADDFTEYEREIRSRPDYDLWVNTERGAFLGQGSRPRSFFPEAKSIVCAVYSFADIHFPEELDQHIGRAYLSRSYIPLDDSSCGIRINAFCNFLESVGCNIYKGEIDIPNRMACARAGVISYGKNNFAYTDEDGSFIILYTFIVDRELDYDEPTIECKCPPNCHACIDACPTHAIISPGRLHPQHCLLYNHILKDQIPAELREGMGIYIHGCDICQKVCPRNKKMIERASRKDPFLEELKSEFDLEKTLLMDDAYYQDVIRPIMYNYIRDIDLFRRNAAIALGNTDDPAHIPALENATQSQNPLVKEAAEWAIKKLLSGIDHS
ncbi:MAG: 4Fe-4S double cluster binding domain-containing protein [Tissierellia bacterium]|nr:4Fe-4S double cluster binding domain-containing protein [Tissierellia bacterium]